MQKDFDFFGGIEVSSDEGMATLSGTVGNADQRSLAELIDRGDEGVEDVVNELDVTSTERSTPAQQPPDR